MYSLFMGRKFQIFMGAYAMCGTIEAIAFLNSPIDVIIGVTCALVYGAAATSEWASGEIKWY